MGIRRYHLIISGKVQGVGYRMSALEAAQSLNLSGWVSNLSDGRVEVIAESEQEKLEQFVTWAKQGPVYANVTEVKLEELAATGEFIGFNIR